MEAKSLIINRYSIRSFTDRPVERQTLIEISETAQFAPSVVNFQPWQFIVIGDPEKLKAIHEVYPRNWFR